MSSTIKTEPMLSAPVLSVPILFDLSNHALVAEAEVKATRATKRKPKQSKGRHFGHFQAWSPMVAKGLQGSRGTPGLVEMS